MRPAASISLGHAVERAGGRSAVTSSPVVPSPRVAARRAAALVDDRQRQAVELRHHDDLLAREARHERLDLLGRRGLLEREHRPLVADRRVQHGRRADPLQRVGVGREVGVLGEQRAQLVLELVVLEVRDLRRAVVVGGAVAR